MAEVDVDPTEKILIELSLQEASLLMSLLSRFNPEAAGPFKDIYLELEDAGVEMYDNVLFLSQNEPNLFLVVTKDDDSQT